MLSSLRALTTDRDAALLDLACHLVVYLVVADVALPIYIFVREQ